MSEHERTVKDVISTAASEAEPANVIGALEILLRFGQFDGEHHKAWVIDQVVWKLAGIHYTALIDAYCDGVDGPDTYEWDEGIAP